MAPTNGYTPPTLYGPDGKPLGKDGYGDLALPHVLTYASILGGAYKTYFHGRHDEAQRFGRDHAVRMRNDAFLMGLLQERKLAVASLPWHLEVPDERDPRQTAVRDALTRTIRDVPFLDRLLWALLEAIWYGRHAVQIKWGWEADGPTGRRVLTAREWQPVNGDKIGHHFDGTPYVLVYGGEPDALRGARTTYTTVAKAVDLVGGWRERFVIHRHEQDDADYFDVEAADAAHGVGVRSRVFWLNWVRLEYGSWLSDYLERIGLGLTVWYYELGNPKSKELVTQAAEEQSGRVNLILPRSAGGKDAAGVERIETPATGAEVIRLLQEPLRDDITRYVVGQTLSHQAESTGLGSKVADLHAQTKHKIAAFDARLLAATLTGYDREPGLVSMMQKWSFPETLPGRPGGFRVRWVFDVEKEENKEKLDAIKTVVDLRIPVKADEVRAAAGLSKPAAGDEVVHPPRQGMPGVGGQEGAGGPPGEGGSGSPPPASGPPNGGGRPPPEPPGPSPSGVGGKAPVPFAEAATPAPGAGGDEAALAHARDMAQFLTALAAVGIDPAEQRAKVNAELAGTGYCVERGALGRWHAVREAGGGAERMGHEEDAERYAAQRAPKGGVTIDGTHYVGGQWIPGSEIEKASPEDKAKLGAQAETDRGRTESRAAERAAKGPVDAAALGERLRPHARELTAIERKSATASWALLNRHHGANALRRVEELAGLAEQAHAAATEAGEEGLANYFSGQLAKYHHMLRMAGRASARPWEDGAAPTAQPSRPREPSTAKQAAQAPKPADDFDRPPPPKGGKSPEPAAPASPAPPRKTDRVPASAAGDPLGKATAEIPAYAASEARDLPDAGRLLADLGGVTEAVKRRNHGLASLRDVYDGLKALHPALTLEDFHRQLLAWRAADAVVLQVVSDPYLLPPTELEHAISLEGGPRGPDRLAWVGHVHMRPPAPAPSSGPSDADALSAIRSAPGGGDNLVKLADLGKRLGLNPAQVALLVRDLHRKGLVTVAAREGRHGADPEEAKYHYDDGSGRKIGYVGVKGGG